MDFVHVQEVHVFQRPLEDVKAYVGGACDLVAGHAAHTTTRGIVRLSRDDVQRILAAYTVTPEVTRDFVALLPAAILEAARGDSP